MNKVVLPAPGVATGRAVEIARERVRLADEVLRATRARVEALVAGPDGGEEALARGTDEDRQPQIDAQALDGDQTPQPVVTGLPHLGHAAATNDVE